MNNNYDEMMETALSAVEVASVSMLPIAALLNDDSPRLAGTNPEHVRALAQVEQPMPPIVVHRPTMRVIDGAHRLKAARLRNESHIATKFFEGDLHMAFMLAVVFNVEHGLPLTLSDRSAAAERMLCANPLLSDRTIASTVGLSAVTIASIRQRSADQSIQSNVRLGMDGKVRPLSSAEGRRKASTLIGKNPSMPLREVARRSGIALATASDVRKRVLRGDDPVPLRHQDEKQRRREPGRRPGRVIGPPERAAIIQVLVRDPTLRYTDAGRTALSWLSPHALGIERGQQFISVLPSHCLERLAEVARGCADEWRALADKLESRIQVQQQCETQKAQ